MSSFLKDPNAQLFSCKDAPLELDSAVDLRSNNCKEPSGWRLAMDLRDWWWKKERKEPFILWAILLLATITVMMARWYGITITGNYIKRTCGNGLKIRSSNIRRFERVGTRSNCDRIAYVSR
jgi:hypothetical protein